MSEIRFVPLLALVAVLACVASAPAQFSPIPRSGCPGATVPSTTGTPGLGQSVSLTCAPCASPRSTPFMVVGARMPIGVAIARPLSCPPACDLVCQPLYVEVRSTYPLTVPNDVALVGQCICVQCGCLEQPPGAPQCVTLQVGVDLCVTR